MCIHIYIYIVYVYIPSPKSGNPPFSQNFLAGSPGNEITFCHNLTSRVLLSQMSQQHLTSKRRGLQGFSVLVQTSTRAEKMVPRPRSASAK